MKQPSRDRFPSERIFALFSDPFVELNRFRLGITVSVS